MPEHAIPTVAERLRLIGKVARRRWILVASVTLITTCAAVVVASRAGRTYSATARLVLGNTQLVGVPASIATVPNPDPERDVNTKVALIRAMPVATAVDRRLGWPVPVDTL